MKFNAKEVIHHYKSGMLQMYILHEGRQTQRMDMVMTFRKKQTIETESRLIGAEGYGWLIKKKFDRMFGDNSQFYCDDSYNGLLCLPYLMELYTKKIDIMLCTV